MNKRRAAQAAAWHQQGAAARAAEAAYQRMAEHAIAEHGIERSAALER